MAKKKSKFHDMFKNEGHVIPHLDEYLFQLGLSRDGNRAVDVNSPSMAGGCLRRSYYSRIGTEYDSPETARGRRVLDNGNYFHDRMQKYLSDSGQLIMDEVPIIYDKYKIQGHTDGYLDLEVELAILELKSIKTDSFKELKDAKPEHKIQGAIYLLGAEKRRQHLRDTYKTRKEFLDSVKEREKYFASKYQHMKGGSKFSREEKIKFQVELNIISDDILYDIDTPITKVIFLYEDKDTQNLKEFTLELADPEKEIAPILGDFTYLNECVKSREVPPRNKEYNKSAPPCKWCAYKETCFVL